MIKTIRQSILGNPLTVVFDDCFSHASVPLVQNLLLGSTYRLSLNDTITSLSSCIIQSVNVCASEEEKLSKVCISISMLSKEFLSKFITYIAQMMCLKANPFFKLLFLLLDGIRITRFSLILVIPVLLNDCRISYLILIVSHALHH
jgi:hypothetical protein